MDCARLYALVKYLPPEAALWRVQQTEENGEVIRTNDPDEIKRFLSDAFGQPSSDSGGFVFPGG